ncbi:AMP-dependent synthetase/ligase [Aestuariispira ectoiniformans]|uniref:AMP-dependent synthetase/ligase n=1 Tax=Aestuariispira ectoiniformans TaxID=2775080 RepID=UPI002882D882|nr:AMP-dependent synthetase/ligase [Aestuariispira ectoiniformans]
MIDYDNVKNLPSMFFDQAARLKDAPFLWSKKDGQWLSQSWSQVADETNRLSRGLRAKGVKPGDRVLLLSENRPKWLMADVAIMATGAITTPAYTTNTEADHLHILHDSGARVAIVSTAKLAKRFLPAAVQAGLDLVIVMEEPDNRPGQSLHIETWDDMLALGAEQPDDVMDLVNAQKRGDTCCIIYTSGTSGTPNGVMLSHGAIISNCMGAEDVLQHLPGYGEAPEVFLSFLPLSHSYEHTAGQFVPVAWGAQIYYAESIDKLINNIAEVRPTIMVSVPRLYETIRGRVLKGAEQADGLKAKMLYKAVELGAKAYQDPKSLTFTERLLNRLLDKLVRRKVQERFGGRLKAFVSGGGPLNYDVGLFFLALGLRVLQGYGQTESAPVAAVNRCELNDLCTVGPPMKDVEVKIAEDGEILIRGELVMNGYWKQPERTAEVIIDGWLHTGDIGELNENGYLKITDRKKDIIVNSGGDNISPQRVEGILCLEPEIEQCMIYGDNRPHLVGIIVPNQEFIETWCKENNVDPKTLTADDKAFKSAIHAAVDRANKKMSVIEKVRRFALVMEPFSVENEMLTPSMKVRRHVVKHTYGQVLNDLYKK